MIYPWYSVVEGPELEQGDIFYSYPVLVTDLSPADIKKYIDQDIEGLETEAVVNLIDVIILTQSCDLANAKVETVMLCPLWKIGDANPPLGRNKLENIRKGNVIQSHMLNKCDEVGAPISVVEFTRIYMTSTAALKTFATAQGQRRRLNPPYREHLSQAFARYFMRVGLPSDIQEF